MKNTLLSVCVLLAGYAFGALSSKSYVQDGLLVHWDGIENVGRGLEHDNGATLWKDLSGNGLDMTIPQGSSFGDGYLDVIRAHGSDVVNGRIPEKDQAIRAAFKAARYTSEIVYDMTNFYPKTTVMMLCLGNTSYFIGSYYSDYENRIGFSPNGAQNGVAPTAYVNVSAEDKTGLQHFVCRQNELATCVRLYSHGRKHMYVKSGTVKSFDPDVATDWKFKFNKTYNEASDVGFDGKCYGVRVYGRALDDDELAVNHAVDRVRYFGDAASDLTLPDGWKFEVQGDDVRLYRRLRVRAADASGAESAGGKIAVGEGSDAPEHDVWCEQGGTVALTVKAVANEGYVFCGWLGVEGEQKHSAEITVETGCGLTAVFRRNGDAVPMTWTGAKSGEWSEKDNWLDNFGFKVLNAPAAGDSVTIPEKCSVTLRESSPQFAAMSIEGTLVLTNWYTCLNAQTVTIAPGGTLTCGAPATNMTDMSRVWIRCRDLTVVKGGTVDVSQKGYFGWPKGGGAANGGRFTSGWGPGSVSALQVADGREFVKLLAPSHGGYGGRMPNVEVWYSNLMPYDDPAAPELPGSSGGSNEYGFGGHGGGAVKIEASGTVTVNGSVLADGRNCSSFGSSGTASNHGQPGAGGSIYITCGSISGSGRISAAGGGGDNPKLLTAVPAMAAGGGMIAIHYDSTKQNSAAVAGMQISAAAGLYKTTAFTTTCFNADTNRWEADIGTLHFTDGKILDELLGNGLTGQIRGIAAYERGDGLVFTNGHVRFAEEGVKVSVAGDLTLGGIEKARLELGGAIATNRSSYVDLWAGNTPCSLTVGGDLTLEGVSRMDVRAAATNGIDRFGAVVKVAGKMTIGGNCLVTASCDLENLGAPRFEVGSLHVATGGVFTAKGRGGRGGYAIYNHATGKVVTLGDGAGPGRASPNAGASHGGKGGAKGARAVYGDEKRPLIPGSGGSAATQRVAGGAGGGLVYVSATNGNIVVDGEINADALGGGKLVNAVGASWGYGGGGSGGSILLESKVFRLGNTGLLSACGGGTTPYSTIPSGSGGGGRIAVWCGSPWREDLPRSLRVVSSLPIGGRDVDEHFSWEGACSVAPGTADGQYVTEETVSANTVRSAGDPGTTCFGFVREKMLGFWVTVR